MGSLKLVQSRSTTSTRRALSILRPTSRPRVVAEATAEGATYIASVQNRGVGSEPPLHLVGQGMLLTGQAG